MIEQLLAYNTIVVLLGVSILGAGAGLVGSFAVLRKRALTGDAVAHSALPGVCAAFLILGQRNLSFMRSISCLLAAGTVSFLTFAQEAPAPDKPVFKPEELEQIVAPIALYPDALLAQIFMPAPADWAWRCSATSASSTKRRPSACSRAAGACR